MIDPGIQEELLASVQARVPFTADPFGETGRPLGLNAAQVLEQLRGWEQEGILREISAILEGEALGYDSALVAARVPEARIEEVAERINAHPTVTHNYLRDHDYNLWFTIAVPEEMGLDRTLQILSGENGVRMLPLRRTATFKIGVRFRRDRLENASPVVELSTPKRVHHGPEERRMFRALQRPLPYVAQPFRRLADEAGVAEERLLSFANSHQGGAIRKYVATLRHKRMGVRANGMVVWDVAADSVREAGAKVAAAPQVSHCYARNPIEGFPYTLYSMIHGPDEESVRRVAADLSKSTAVDRYAVLFSTREFKKCRLRYFLPELTEWWKAHAGREVSA